MENTKEIGGEENQALVLNVDGDNIPIVVVTPPPTQQNGEKCLLHTVIITERENKGKIEVEFAGETGYDPEVSSMLFEEETPTTSASSEATGSLKLFLEETCSGILKQSFFPFLISGIGLGFAGQYLDYVRGWQVFIDIPQLIILVPALVGLKGNLEMTLASRLSTQAHLGNMKNLKSKVKLTMGNLCLVQCQAIVLAFLASNAALLFGLYKGHFSVFHALVVVASSLTTASLASFGIGIFTSLAVIGSSALNINPDNIAAPLAASLGDIVTVFCLGHISSRFYDLGDLAYTDVKIWILLGVLGIFFLIPPLCFVLGRRSKTIEPLFKNGWISIIIAVIVSSFAGYILEQSIQLSGVAIFQPFFCGVGGGIAAVQASRISTYLHQKFPLGILPDEFQSWYRNPLFTFFSLRGNSVAARALVVLAIPSHVAFFIFVEWTVPIHSEPGKFIPFYITAAIIQVLLMLYTAEVIVNLLWFKKKDPDSEAIPYLTAFGDVTGIIFLVLAFGSYNWVYGKANRA